MQEVIRSTSSFMKIISAGKTDIGLVRQANEDCIALYPDQQLYIVCDGMGGHNAGEVASSTACGIIGRLYSDFFERLLKDEQLKLPRVFPPTTDVLLKAIRIANHCINHKAEENPSLSGMGTTIVAVVFEKDIISVAHVGDSRVYRYFDNKLTPLTIDHSWVAELQKNEQLSSDEVRNLVNRNVITRALGVKTGVDIDVSVRKVAENDFFLLCSDGLCGYVEDSDIRHVIKANKGDANKIATQLVQLANDRGGQDNVSVLALQIENRVDPSDLQTLDMITVDTEPPAYYESEKQWGQSVAQAPEKPTRPPAVPKRRGGGSAPFFWLAIIVLIAIFYLIFKGLS